MGLITYMRTDSVNVSTAAVQETREYIRAHYGREYAPEQPRAYRTRSKNAQEAHEAIRPTSIRRTPQEVAAYLDRDQLRLYRLIWERMVASQMADAILEATTVDIDARCAVSDAVYLFRATGSVLQFAGFRAVYLEGRDDAAAGNGNGNAAGNDAAAGGDDDNVLPELAAGDGLLNRKLDANQHFTPAPAPLYGGNPHPGNGGKGASGAPAPTLRPSPLWWNGNMWNGNSAGCCPRSWGAQ